MDEPSYRKLLVWQKAHNNALSIINLLDRCDYKYTGIFSQCLNAATSIGANIAEGNVNSNKEKKRYFEIALNSSYELDNWLQILKDSKAFHFDKEKLILIEKENIAIIKILSRIIFNLKS